MMVDDELGAGEVFDALAHAGELGPRAGVDDEEGVELVEEVTVTR